MPQSDRSVPCSGHLDTVDFPRIFYHQEFVMYMLGKLDMWQRNTWVVTTQISTIHNISEFYVAFTNRLIVIVTSPLHESRLLWIHDPHHRQSSRVPTSHPPASQKNNTVPRINDTVPRTNDTVPRTNYTVPRNIYQPPRQRENAPRNNRIVPSSDARVRAPLESISSSVWHNSSLSSHDNNCPPVPRNNVTDRQTDK